MIGNFRNAALHITGSIAFLILPFLFSPDGPHMGLSALREIAPMQRDFLTYVLLLGVFYITFFLLIPKLYFSKRYVLFILAVAACYAVINNLPYMLVPEQAFPAGNTPPPPPHRFLVDPRHFFLFLFVIVLAMVIRIGNRWKRTEKEKLQAELFSIKAQINPHFLFNMLNTIYALALDKSEQAPEAIVKLSGMMRHVISEAGNDKVDLGAEIDYIEDYIALQQIRYGDAVQLHVSITGDPGSKKVVPLILVPLIEGAFKYGVNPDEQSEIRIRIAMEQYTVRMEVYNRKVHTTDGDGGYALRTTRTRLKLLYPGKHLLTVRNTANDFLISLTLQVE